MAMERLREAIAGRRVELADGGRIACTASIGIATLRDAASRTEAANDGDTPPDAAFDTLVATADRRMYGAKAAGKNRVAAGEQAPAPPAAPAGAPTGARAAG
jgi:GGDEF domain-containing protein